MPSPFAQMAEGLDALSAIFDARRRHGGAISAGQAASVADALKAYAELARLGERQRVALLTLAGRPVEDGITVVLAPFATLEGGRA